MLNEEPIPYQMLCRSRHIVRDNNVLEQYMRHISPNSVKKLIFHHFVLFFETHEIFIRPYDELQQLMKSINTIRPPHDHGFVSSDYVSDVQMRAAKSHDKLKDLQTQMEEAKKELELLQKSCQSAQKVYDSINENVMRLVDDQEKLIMLKVI